MKSPRPASLHRVRAAAAAAVLLACARGAVAAALPHYAPALSVSGIIRTWGSADMGPLMKSWESGFRHFQPEVQFSDFLKGSETGHAGLYTGAADLALMGREALMLDMYGLFVKTRHYPLQLAVATGSYDVPNKTFALAIFVNRENPLATLTIKQLDGIFGGARTGGWDALKLAWHREVARGAQDDIRTWGKAGLTGEWADKPIHGYGYPFTSYAGSPIDAGAMYFFRIHVLQGADKWNFQVSEFEKGQEIAAAVGNDRYGIGYAGMCYKTDAIKPVALAPRKGGDAVLPTRETVANRTYPLTRSVYICLDKAPGKPADPKLREFLRYVLSREGQADVARDNGYLPLTESIAAKQLKTLE